MKGNKKVLFTEVVVNPGRDIRPGTTSQLWSCEQGMTLGQWYHHLKGRGVVVDHLKPFRS